MPPLPNHIITSIPAKCIIKFWEKGGVYLTGK